MNCNTNTYIPPFRSIFFIKVFSDTEESYIINNKRSHVFVDIRNTAMSFVQKHYCTTIEQNSNKWIDGSFLGELSSGSLLKPDASIQFMEYSINDSVLAIWLSLPISSIENMFDVTMGLISWTGIKIFLL